MICCNDKPNNSTTNPTTLLFSATISRQAGTKPVIHCCVCTTAFCWATINFQMLPETCNETARRFRNEPFDYVRLMRSIDRSIIVRRSLVERSIARSTDPLNADTILFHITTKFMTSVEHDTVLERQTRKRVDDSSGLWRGSCSNFSFRSTPSSFGVGFDQKLDQLWIAFRCIFCAVQWHQIILCGIQVQKI